MMVRITDGRISVSGAKHGHKGQVYTIHNKESVRLTSMILRSITPSVRKSDFPAMGYRFPLTRCPLMGDPSFPFDISVHTNAAYLRVSSFPHGLPPFIKMFVMKRAE